MSACVILIIEIIYVGIIVWKICQLQLCARISKYWSGEILKVPQIDEMNLSNSEKDVEKIERNEDKRPLLNSSTESEKEK